MYCMFKHNKQMNMTAKNIGIHRAMEKGHCIVVQL